MLLPLPADATPVARATKLAGVGAVAPDGKAAAAVIRSTSAEPADVVRDRSPRRRAPLLLASAASTLSTVTLGDPGGG